jgi:hypothetical protein
MKKMGVLTVVIALAATLGFIGSAHAGGLSAPTPIICTTDVTNSELDVSWSPPTTINPDPAVPAEKYGVEFSCVNQDTSEVILDMGTSDVADDCEFFGLAEGCSQDLTAFSLPISELTVRGALSGATCTVSVKGVHKKHPEDPKGHNSANLHLVGSESCSAALP